MKSPKSSAQKEGQAKKKSGGQPGKKEAKPASAKASSKSQDNRSQGSEVNSQCRQKTQGKWRWLPRKSFKICRQYQRLLRFVLISLLTEILPTTPFQICFYSSDHENIGLSSIQYRQESAASLRCWEE